MSSDDEKEPENKKFSEKDRCYRCGLQGHYGYDCDKFHGKSTRSEKVRKHKRSYKDDDKCYECGVEGHYGYDCPERILRVREGELEANKKISGRASPRYDDYKIESRDRSRSRSPAHQNRRPRHKSRSDKDEKIIAKSKSKNVRNIRNLWSL